jgi:hypothetical protein
MSLTWPVKDPNAVLDYFIDWTLWLTTGDTIDNIVWTVPSGLTLETQTISGAKAYAWLSGGTDGVSYNILCRVTTVDGRVDDRTVSIQVSEK